jgi:NAD(P)-dependent dehydrogenase (short-subunit alcohol dehydrogenase family)
VGGKGCLALKAADVSIEAEVEALFDFALERFEQVDVVVNNAGINRDALLPQTTLEDFQQVMAVNLTGAFLMCRRAIQEFLAQGGGGQLVNISSVSRHGAVSQSAYAASKGGLEGLTRTIAKEYGHKGVRANVVVVGYVPTALTKGTTEALLQVVVDATPLRRAGTPAEVAKVALFLASARAGYINGETVHATGGLRELPR